MPNFNALNTGEALIGVQKSNDSLQCPEGGNAADIVGAVVAGVALTAATSVAAATTKFVSDGIGAVTDAAQAAAADTLATAQAEAAALAEEVKAQALAAIGFGPGGAGTEALAEGQTQLDAARAQAEALIGEARAGVDAVLAEAQAAQAAAEQFIADKIAEGQALLAEGQAAVTAAVAGLIGRALAAVPPLPAVLTSPAPGAIPVPPLPVDVPVVSKVIPTEIAVPAPNLAIASPENLAESIAGGVAVKAGSSAVQLSPLEEVVLSRSEIDECANDRTEIVAGMEEMLAKWEALEARISGGSNNPEHFKIEPGFLGFGKTIKQRNFVPFDEALVTGIFPGGPRNIARTTERIILRKGSSQSRDLVQIGPLAGVAQWRSLATAVTSFAEFTGKCEDLGEIKTAIGKKGQFISEFDSFFCFLVLAPLFDANNEDLLLKRAEEVLSRWDNITQKFFFAFPERFRDLKE